MDKLKTSQLLQELQQQNAALLAENSYLKQELAQLRHFIFGQKRERFVSGESQDQLGLDLDDSPVELETSLEHISYERKKVTVKPARHGRGDLPAHLKRREVLIEPDEDVSGLNKIGEEITEELDYEPGQLYVNRYIRPKYVRPQNEGVVIGLLPSRPIEKGIAGAGLLSHIMISKYVDHLPVYRQIQQFKRQDIKLAKSTVDDWIRSCCDLLEPLYAAHKHQLLQTDYLMIDETPIRVLDKRKKGRSHQGYFWVYYDPIAKRVLFDYREGRGREGPDTMLQDFIGTIQTDGYGVYEQVAAGDRIKVIGCMAHARRYFKDAIDQDKSRAEWMLKQIQALYKVEERSREQGMSYQKRHALRLEQSQPVLEAMKKWLDENLTEVLPKSLIGKAITYMLGRWKALLGYLEDGRYEIDNNLVENAIRPVALGRKNYLFAGSHNGADRAALIYSLVATAKLQGVEPFGYLKEILTKLPDWPYKKIDELLPQNWTNHIN